MPEGPGIVTVAPTRRSTVPLPQGSHHSAIPLQDGYGVLTRRREAPFRRRERAGMEDAGGGSVVWILVDVGFVLAAVWLLAREDAAGGRTEE